MDDQAGGNPLVATVGDQPTFYLYGLDPLGELGTAWSYSMSDGTGTPRLLTTQSGEVSLSSRYTPWGEVLEVQGQGAFTWGYFGGLLDAATGLIYVGDGQYYDPATGRFLTTKAQPGKTNPYVPKGASDPGAMMIGPLALMMLFIRPRKEYRNRKLTRVLLVLLVLALIGMSVAACNLPKQPDDNQSTTAPTNPPNSGGSTPQPPKAPAPTPNPPTQIPETQPPTECPPTPLPSDKFKNGYYDWLEAVDYAENHWSDYTNAVSSDCTNFVSYALFDGGLNITEKWDPTFGFGPWVNTTDLFSYLTQDLQFNSILFENRKHEGYADYTPLRKYDEWDKFLSSHQQEILPGDIVFYWDAKIFQTWGHAAILAKYGQETVYNTTMSSSATKPLIFEHDGPGRDNDNPGAETQPRSIDDTPNTWIQKIAIVQIRPRK